jgi:hypothetical protein
MLLLAATVVLWVRGQQVADWVRLHRLNIPNRYHIGYTLCTTRGGIYFSYTPTAFDDPSPSLVYSLRTGLDPPRRRVWRHDSGFTELTHSTPNPQVAGGFGPAWLDRLGFGLELNSTRRPGYSHRFDKFEVPYWFLCALFLAGAWPGIRPIRDACVRCLRTRHGRCLKCGYDLRATPGRCPGVWNSFRGREGRRRLPRILLDSLTPRARCDRACRGRPR